jgi:hypothetical protein
MSVRQGLARVPILPHHVLLRFAELCFLPIQVEEIGLENFSKRVRFSGTSPGSAVLVGRGALRIAAAEAPEVVVLKDEGGVEGSSLWALRYARHRLGGGFNMFLLTVNS